MMNRNNASDKNRSSSEKIIITLLTVALVGTWGFILWDKNREKNEKLRTDGVISEATRERDALLQELETASIRYDELKSVSTKKDSIIVGKDYDIIQKQKKIAELLIKSDANTAELMEVKRLLASLRSDIDSYKKQIELLEGRNIELASEKNAITSEKNKISEKYDSAIQVIKDREQVIDVASTLNASGFNLRPVFIDRKGQRKTATRFRNFDLLEVSFYIDENRVAQAGIKTLFIVLKDPSGKILKQVANMGGTFTSRSGEDIGYTERLDLNYTPEERQFISFDFRQSEPFLKGNYQLLVYHNGFKIGDLSTRLF